MLILVLAAWYLIISTNARGIAVLPTRVVYFAAMNIYRIYPKNLFFLFFIAFLLVTRVAQSQDFTWTADGTGFLVLEENSLIKYDLKSSTRTVVIPANDLRTQGEALPVRAFYFSSDGATVLLYTHSEKVWRLDTRGDYWTYNLQTKTIRQLGAKLPA